MTQKKNVYYHTAAWCAPCRNLKPKVQKVAEEAGAEFIEIDIDKEEPMLPGIMSIPTVVIQRAGVATRVFTGASANAIGSIREALR